MEYTFGDNFKGGPICLGLHKPKHYHDIISTRHCNIVPEDFIRQAVEDFAREKNLSFYHRRGGQGYLRHLVIRTAFASRQLMINRVTRSYKEEDFVQSAYSRSTSYQSTYSAYDFDNNSAATCKMRGRKKDFCKTLSTV